MAERMIWVTRKEAREQAFILIFEKSFHDEEIPELMEMAKEGRDLEDDPFMIKAAEGVISCLDELDTVISEYLTGWKIGRLSRVSLAAMRLAVYEMKYLDDIPVSVSINEAVELTKRFASTEDSSYLNGVLGSIARRSNIIPDSKKEDDNQESGKDRPAEGSVEDAGETVGL